LVTPEARPLAVFGKPASDAVGRLLDEAGVDFVPNRAPVSFGHGTLELSSGPGVYCDLVVSLPTPVVPQIPGLPQRPPQGFIPVDGYMGVDGLGGVWAAGDATFFPIKQGGIAAQQADVAAATIAELAGAPVRPQEFHPILRGAILTGNGPRYLRAEERVESSAAARSVLWWPPSKVAGARLAPYLARKAGGRTGIPDHLTDLDAPPTDDAAKRREGHEDVVAMALESADIHASDREFDRALDWLKVAEDLELYLPPQYEHKRTSWTELAHGDRA
jgi:sulfide:quinone oxidoreductase